MKFKHNKKRNTAFIYETLIMEISKASMNRNEARKSSLVKMLKENFSKGTLLRKDLDIYRSFEKLNELDEDTIVKIIHESKEQFVALDRHKVFEEQTKLINEINKSYGVSVWSNFVSNYKKLATINQALNRDLSPKKQVLVEKKLISMLSYEGKDKNPFPNVNNLAVKTFIEKFNKEYEVTLQPEQKRLLEKYITSYEDDGIEFKVYFYEEIDRIKDELEIKKSTEDHILSEKLQKIITRIEEYNKRPLDRNLITEVMKIQSLIKEIK